MIFYIESLNRADFDAALSSLKTVSYFDHGSLEVLTGVFI